VLDEAATADAVLSAGPDAGVTVPPHAARASASTIASSLPGTLLARMAN